MAKNWLGMAKLSIEIIIVAVILWYIFQIVVQPVLVSINPVFADLYAPAAEQSGRSPENPAQIALYATGIVGFAVYAVLRVVIMATFKFNVLEDEDNVPVLTVIHAVLGLAISSVIPKTVRDWFS